MLTQQPLRLRQRLFRFSAAIALSATLASCVTTDGNGMGEKETVGTGAGALIGGIAGAFLGQGKGKVVAIIAGAALGGLIGNQIGEMLDEQDQAALQEQARQALLTHSDDDKITWSSTHSDAKATVTPTNTRIETREVKIVRDAAVQPAPALDLINALYVAPKSATVRLAPSSQAEIARTLPHNSKVWAIGRVQGKPWIMVAQKGKSIGYVAVGQIRQAPTQTAKLSVPTPEAKPSAKMSPKAPTHSSTEETAAATTVEPFNLDDVPVRTPADLDALGNDEKADIIVASVTCRDLNTEASAKGHSVTSSQTACKSPDGSWELN